MTFRGDESRYNNKNTTNGGFINFCYIVDDSRIKTDKTYNGQGFQEWTELYKNFSHFEIFCGSFCNVDKGHLYLQLSNCFVLFCFASGIEMNLFLSNYIGFCYR